MGSFLKLLSVENTKLWKRFSTKLMILILAAVIIGLCGLQKLSMDMVKNSPDYSNKTSQSETVDWKQQLNSTDAAMQAQIDSMEKSKVFSQKNSLDNLKKQLAENKYYLEHNQKPPESELDNFWDVMTGMGVWQLVALLAIIACTALIAGEFSESTMKTMISRPFARWQILTAKFISVFIYSLVLTIVSYLSSIIATALFFSTKGLDKGVLLWIGGNIVNVPGFAASLITFGMGFLSALVYIIFTFALSAVTRSRALATGLAIFLMFGGTFTALLAYNFSWVKYIFFADTNFSSFLTNGGPFYGISLSLALIICAVYCIAFFFAGYFTFAKRDIS
jgi:ABC-2 type transport system permease protein